MLREHIRRQKRLNPEEERDLLRRAAGGDPWARDRLVSSHLPFVIKIARRYRSYGVPMNDLIQEGTIGLLHAVRRFNPEREARLATYALWWIRAAIQDHVMRSFSMVRGATSSKQRSQFFRPSDTSEEQGDDGSSEAAGGDGLLSGLAQRVGSTVADVRARRRRAIRRDLSLDQVPLNRGGRDAQTEASGPLIDQIADPRPTPEERVVAANDTRALQTAVEWALGLLPPREALIVRLRFMSETKVTRDAIGARLGISKYRVRQLELRALRRLKESLSRTGSALET